MNRALQRWLLLPLILLMLGFYGYRAVRGYTGSDAIIYAEDLANRRKHAKAARHFRKAAVGIQRLRAARREGESHLSVWDQVTDDAGLAAGNLQHLSDAAERFLECLCLAPASRRGWEGLGDVYDRLEWLGRHTRAEAPLAPEPDPWARVGRPGRIALGMMRLAVESAPNWFQSHDALAVTFWLYGLDEQSIESTRRTAQVLPVWVRHELREYGMPDTMFDAFVEASWEVAGQVPLVHSTDHYIDLGKLELRRGNLARAEDAMWIALDGRADPLNRAEAHFNLGLIKMAQERYDEARSHLSEASEHSVFSTVALLNLARLAEQAGDTEQALEHLRRLRWEDPTNLEYCLRFAEVARQTGQWPQALEALQWAKLNHPSDPSPGKALVATRIAKGDLAAALVEFRELEKLAPEDPEVAWLGRRLIEETQGTDRP